MRNITWTITLLCLAASPAAFADTASKREMVGAGSGALVGAIAGGPFGFVFGMAVGAAVGDSMQQKSEKIDTLSASLDSSHAQMSALESDVNRLRAEVARARDEGRPEVASLLEAGIAMDLLFRTDEHVLVDTTSGRLADLAVTIASMPDIKVQLDGFADERGDADYNQGLSERRVEFVREQLVAAGVDPARITANGHGESKAGDETVDSFALERRVSITLFIDDTPSFAANPD